MHAAEGMQCIEVWTVSPREARRKIFTLNFQLSRWALVAPSCFALQVPYVRGSMLQRDVLSGEGGGGGGGGGGGAELVEHL